MLLFSLLFTEMINNGGWEKQFAGERRSVCSRYWHYSIGFLLL